MTWDDLIEYNRRWVEQHHTVTYQAEAARRMTVMLDFMTYLRSDLAVDRVAAHLYYQDFSSPMSEHSSWCTNPSCDLIDGYRVDAGHLINALIGEG